MWKRLNGTPNAVLGLQARLDDIELQWAHHADDRMAQSSSWGEHLHQAFFLELPYRFVKSLVTTVSGPQVGEALCGKSRNWCISNPLTRM